jgi:hydroxymethylbilane synthase
MDWLDNVPLAVGARSSALSRAQVEEVLLSLRLHYSEISFDPIWISTYGDADLLQSLKGMDKTDFFTREIDQMLLHEQIRIAIHSAKDLPSPLPAGIVCVALTKGVDPSDSLVLRDADSLEALPEGAKIATSSIRREAMIRKIRSDLTCVEVRGPVDQRLQALYEGYIDGLVVAEAALIRLNKTDCNRIRLAGPVAEFQGQLAVLARLGDSQMEALFACLDVDRYSVV